MKTFLIFSLELHETESHQTEIESTLESHLYIVRDMLHLLVQVLLLFQTKGREHNVT